MKTLTISEILAKGSKISKIIENMAATAGRNFGGEFVGGADIVTKMHQGGELAELFKRTGVELDPEE